MSVEVQNSIVLWVIIPILVIAVLCMSRLAVHTQRTLAARNEKDPMIDALVWLYRHTSRRPHR